MNSVHRFSAAVWVGLFLVGVSTCTGWLSAQPEDVADVRGLRAPSDEAKLESVVNKLQELERELARLGERRQGLLGELHKLDIQIRIFDEQVALFQIQLRRGREEMDRLLVDIEALEASIDSLKPYLERRSVRLYKMGRMSYLRLLMSLKDTSDLTRAYRYVSRLAEADAKKMQEYSADQVALELARAALVEQSHSAEATRLQLQTVTSSLKRRQANRSALLANVNAREENAGLLVSELEDVRTRLSELVETLSPEGVATSGASEEILLPIRMFEGQLGWPVEGNLDSRFGRRLHPRFKTVTIQNGLELTAEEGTDVHAVYDGVVAYASWFEGYGRLLIVAHPGSVHSLYGYLSDFVVEEGDAVRAGQRLGYVGETGSIAGPRLYFEIRSAGKPVDPERWLNPGGGLASSVDLHSRLN